MILLALVLTFVWVVATGPAGQEWRGRRRERHAFPAAKVIYLPTATCRHTGEVDEHRLSCTHRVYCPWCWTNTEKVTSHNG